VIKDITIYKSRGAAIWARGENHVFDGLKIADSAIGYTHAYPGVAPYHGDYTSKVMNSVFVGESDNKGTPTTDAEKAYGRTLPRADADYPIHGYEYYDFLHHVVNTKFVNYQDNATRKSGALSYLLYTSFPISTNNDVEKLTFENAKPVYFPPEERRWSFSGEFGRFTGWNGAVFHDIDGSVGGVRDSYIVIDNGIADDDKACELKPSWNAAVCRGDYGRVNFGAAGGAGGGRGARGGAAGPGAAAGRGGPGAPGGAGAPGRAGARGGAGAPGGAAGPGRGGAAGRGGFGGGNPPITLSRNGKELDANGSTTIRSGTEIKAVTDRPSMSISVSELDAGSWVIFELPGFTSATAGTAQDSLDALRKSTSTSYYRGDGSLWVKLVSAGGGGPTGRGAVASIQVSR
jgi:cell migration-inducing and hyaluronan-binding protein